MSRIALLSDEVASQVAAGEVVERPAAVVKELVENAIDAEARQIEVMVRRGGISLIRVIDDGIGMDRDDALLCLERHATSKIRSGADLSAIRTLGFRGEALPSIASVSRFRLTTRERGAIAGTEIQITGGRIDHVRDGGEAPGTQIEVRSLFFNLPARRRFLRTENTEMSHVTHQLQLQAIGHPQIGFLLRTDEQLIYQLPPAASLRERVHDLAGAALAKELLEIPPAHEEGAVTISGLIGRASISRSTRSQQLVFVNGRAVENATINHALREGYHTALMKGQFPITYLFLELDPAAVDVNVHPAKREVRFRDPGLIREAVVAAVRRTLESDRERFSESFAAPNPAIAPPLPSSSATASPETPAFPELSALLPALAPTLPPATHLSAAPPVLSTQPERSFTPPPVVPAPSVTSFAVPGERDETQKPYRLLGVIGKLYVVMENATGLVLVDQHAAHERVLFEEMRRRMEVSGVPSQQLLMPSTLQLSPRDSDWVAQNLETLHKMGIGIEAFGNGTWKLDSLPPFVRSREPLQLLRELIDELRTVSTQSSKLRLGEEVIAKTVCRAAVKANDDLRGPEIVRLIEDLLACDLPYCCPHGRPTMIQLSYPELEKKFGRRV